MPPDDKVIRLAALNERHPLTERPADAAPESSIRFEAIMAPSLADLEHAPITARTWFWESLLPAGAFLFIGRPKIGKSWLLLQLLRAAVRGESFLGYQNVGGCGALYVSPEDDDSRLRERTALMMGSGWPAEARIVNADLFRDWAERYGHVSLVDFFDGFLTAHPTIKALILDTEMTCRAVWGDEVTGGWDIKARDYAAAREFDRLALKHRALVILVNHAKKRDGTCFDLHETINRTGVAAAGASGSIVLADPPDRRFDDDDDKRRVLAIRGRDIRDDILLAVEQQADASFTSLGFWTAVAATEAEREILEAARELDGESVKRGDWITSRAIGEALDKKAGTVQRTVSRMLKAGRNTWEGYRVETSRSKGLRLVNAYQQTRE